MRNIFYLTIPKFSLFALFLKKPLTIFIAVPAIAVVPLYLMFFLVFVSCGSITKNKTSLEKETKKNKDLNSSSENTKFTLKDGYSFEPIDLTKPMVHGTEKYYNTKIVNTKEVIHEKTKDTTSVKESEKENLDLKDKHKETDNTWLIIGVVSVVVFSFFFFLFIVIVFMFVYFKNQIKSVTNFIPK